jgi:glycosyltransferase involved in cell wall biosynthesis
MAYLYIEPTLRSFGPFDDDRPAGFTERHHFRLPIVSLTAADNLEREIDKHDTVGVIIGLDRGLPGRRQMQIVRQTIRRGRRAFLYWPAESAIEVVDRSRLSSLWRHWLAYNLAKRLLLAMGSKAVQPANPAASLQSQIESSIEAVRPPLEFVTSDFECTKAHVLGGIAEIRRLGAVTGALDDEFRELPAELETTKLPKKLQANLHRTVREMTAVRKSMDSLQPKMDENETALNGVSESLVKLQQFAQRTNTIPAVTSPSSTSTDESFIESLRSAIDTVSAEFAAAKDDMIREIAEIHRLNNLICQIDGELRDIIVEFEKRKIPDMLRGSLSHSAGGIAAMRQGMESLQPHLADGETALKRVGENLENLWNFAQQSRGSPAVTVDKINAAVDAHRRTLAKFREELRPVPFQLARPPSREMPIPGRGAYVRTDYWARLVSGGSYGHTCYVAKELSALTQRFTCFMASHYALLDELGLAQEENQPPLKHASEIDLLTADSFYYETLRDRFETMQPAYIFERICMGNFAAARLSRDFGIPYIVEYNGSEISMRHSFGSGAYEYEDLFLQAEELAFKQATVITVISEHVRDDVVSRGVDPLKILVNPNGVDCDEYAPEGGEERREIRASLGLDDETVVGFIGTFGGWHGIDVLAAALPKICASAPQVKFLLIGDGNLKPQVLDAVRENNLENRVIDVGRTEQRAGARLLKAADIFVSPHSSHMVDSPFFGSPTKLFEYMALGRGIVASDLEQLGVVMSPALRPADFASGDPRVRQERGVLCKPGDVDEFVAGVLALVRHPEVSAALGRNARSAKNPMKMKSF